MKAKTKTKAKAEAQPQPQQICSRCKKRKLKEKDQAWFRTLCLSCGSVLLNWNMEGPNDCIGRKGRPRTR